MDDIKTTSELIEKHGPKILEDILCFYRFFYDKPKKKTSKTPANSLANFFFDDLGNRSKILESYLVDVMKTSTAIEYIKPRERRVIFDEMRDEYYTKNRNRIKRPTFEDIARAYGPTTKENISRMLSYQRKPERLEVHLICMILEARDEIINEFLMSCGENPIDYKSNNTYNIDSRNDMIIYCLKKWIADEDIKIDGYNRTAMDIFNYAQRRFEEIVK